MFELASTVGEPYVETAPAMSFCDTIFMAARAPSLGVPESSNTRILIIRPPRMPPFLLINSAATLLDCTAIWPSKAHGPVIGACTAITTCSPAIAKGVTITHAYTKKPTNIMYFNHFIVPTSFCFETFEKC